MFGSIFTYLQIEIAQTLAALLEMHTRFLFAALEDPLGQDVKFGKLCNTLTNCS